MEIKICWIDWLVGVIAIMANLNLMWMNGKKQGPQNLTFGGLDCFGFQAPATIE